MKALFAFDLDGTLARSKEPLDPAMGALLAELSTLAKVAVISGGDWPQFEKQVVSWLPAAADLSSFFIMPTTGTKLYRFAEGGWRPVYAELFDAEERQRILDALAEAEVRIGVHETKVWGEKIEDRGSQITFSGLGQAAPIEAKEAWDPDRSKRKALQSTLRELLPDLSVNIGGSTSIDITRKGVDKAFGLRKLADASGVALASMLFMGDAIYEGGNDYPARTLGLDTISVRDPQETAAAIATAIACLKP